jgi:hypothetical protein
VAFNAAMLIQTRPQQIVVRSPGWAATRRLLNRGQV